MRKVRLAAFSILAVVMVTGAASRGIVVAQAPSFHSFDFATLADGSTGVGGTTTVDGVKVTLTTTNTERFGTGFRDKVDTKRPAEVTFDFEPPIREFHLRVSYVREDEWIRNFTRCPRLVQERPSRFAVA